MRWKQLDRPTVVALAVCAMSLSHASAADAAPKGTKAMERVVGIGGFFFRAKDPKKLAQWYEENLGIAPVPDSEGKPSWQTEAGTTVFAPFPEDTKQFGDSSHQWMMNFRVRDLDSMAAQLRAKGIAVKIEPEAYSYGRFAELHDPEGNAIQLWQPAGKEPG
jgi:glyoxylase I family protein